MASSQPATSTTDTSASGVASNSTTPLPHPPRPAASNKTEQSKPPACLLACLKCVQDCSASLETCSNRLDQKRLQESDARRRRRRNGQEEDDDGLDLQETRDPLWKRKGIIPLVAVILSWVYIVYVWRLMAPAIQQDRSASSRHFLASRPAGIGLLVGFNILWLLTIWSYVSVIATPPGFVKDEVEECDVPKTREQEWREKGEGGPYLGPDATAQMPASNGPVQGFSSSSLVADHDLTVSSSEEQDGDVDPSLPAILGPAGAGLVAASAEEARLQQQEPPSSSVPPHSEPLSMDPAHQTQTIRPPPSPPPPTGAFPRPPSPVHAREPQRLPPNPDYRPLAPINMYCYRCRLIKPGRAHHCRHCGTCVLKMDHHCPWVGGCVGARNHKSFHHFVFWVTLLELYVLVSTATLFSRGVGNEPGYEAWTLDGFVISLFPICAVFLLFTTPLLFSHTFLILGNMTTIEHLSMSQQSRREQMQLNRYFSDPQAEGYRRKIEEVPTKGRRGWWVVKGKRRIRKGWDHQWGTLRGELHLWKVEQPDQAGKESISPIYRRLNGLQAVGANWRQTMGSAWYGWFLPIGRAQVWKGTDYPVNPRRGPEGEWRERSQWPEELR